MSDETISRGRGRRPAVKVAEGEDSVVVTATENALESISARVLDAEEATARAVARATEALNAAVAAAESAAAKAAERLAETTRSAEEAAERLASAHGEGEAAFGGLASRVTDHVKAAESALESAVRLAGERLEARAAQAVAEGERALQRLNEHLDAQATAAQEAGRVTVDRARTAFRGTEAAGVAMIDGMTQAGQQVADFVDSRIRQDLEVQSALMGCRSIGEVGTVHAQFMRNAIDQYRAEANRLFRLGAEMVAKSAERARL